MQAQLRASVFTALEEHDRSTGVYLENNIAKKIQESSEGNDNGCNLTPKGKMIAELLREFLEFYELESTISVFVPEANLVRLSE